MKSGSVSPSNWSFCNIILTLLVLWVLVQISGLDYQFMQNISCILIKIVVNSETNVGQCTCYQPSLLVREHGVSSHLFRSLKILSSMFCRFTSPIYISLITFSFLSPLQVLLHNFIFQLSIFLYTEIQFFCTVLTLCLENFCISLLFPVAFFL